MRAFGTSHSCCVTGVFPLADRRRVEVVYRYAAPPHSEGRHVCPIADAPAVGQEVGVIGGRIVAHGRPPVPVLPLEPVPGPAPAAPGPAKLQCRTTADVVERLRARFPADTASDSLRLLLVSVGLDHE